MGRQSRKNDKAAAKPKAAAKAEPTEVEAKPQLDPEPPDDKVAIVESHPQSDAEAVVESLPDAASTSVGLLSARLPAASEVPELDDRTDSNHSVDASGDDDDDTDDADDTTEAEPSANEVPRRKPGVYVCDGRSISSRGVVFGPGACITKLGKEMCAFQVERGIAEIVE